VIFRRRQGGADLERKHASAQYNRGLAYLNSAYTQLHGGDREAKLAQAIECFTEALRVFTADAAPHVYPVAQANLGIAYAGLPTGDRAVNLARAIDCYTEALRFYTAEAAPLDYAMAQCTGPALCTQAHRFDTC
jgi:tetratricopeptide (TPR) repeat protein